MGRGKGGGHAKHQRREPCLHRLVGFDLYFPIFLLLGFSLVPSLLRDQILEGVRHIHENGIVHRDVRVDKGHAFGC